MSERKAAAAARPERSEKVAELLWREARRRPNLTAYALVDAARRPYLYAEVHDGGLEHACLLRGTLPPELEEAAPYLVKLTPGAALTGKLLGDGWGDAWGVYVVASATLEYLRDHFRRLLMATTPDGQSFFFRFYDPRVLRVFLPTCDAGQVADLFGRALAFLVEGEGGKTALVFRKSGADLAMETVDLAP